MPDTTITLTNVKCIHTSEPGNDEVYIKYMVDDRREHRFPAASYHSMGPGSVWPVNLPLSFKDSVVVSLFDNDLGNDDFLGSFTYYPNSPQPETVPISNTNGAQYQLTTTPG